MSDALAVVSWWVIMEALGWIVWPLGFRWLKWLPDRGYMVAKPLGLLLVSYGLWLFASLRIVPNSLTGIVCVLVGMVAAVQLLYRRNRSQPGEHLVDVLRRQRKLILTYELVFAAAFMAWAIVRAHSPDALTGEKPMELAFLNAIGRSMSFPPYDPWAAGYTMPYYYFGYVMIGVLIKLSNVSVSTAFGASNGLWFALTAAGTFGVVANAVLLLSHTARLAAVTYGLLGAVMLSLMGNFEAPLEVARVAGWGSPEFWTQLDILDLNESYVPPAPGQPRWPPREGGFGWWWRASRVIHDYWPMDISPRLAAVMGVPPDPQTSYQELIDEFPQFSFLLGDMHPHVLNLPYVLLALTAALNLFQAGIDGIKSLRRAPLWLLYPLLLGCLAFVNTWDFPIYMLVTIAALALGCWFVSHLHLRPLLIDSVLTGFLGLALYAPYYLNTGPQVSGLAPNIFNGTSATQFFVMFGPFIVIAGVFFLKITSEVIRSNGIHWPKFIFKVIAGSFALIISAVVAACSVTFLSGPARDWLNSFDASMSARGITIAAHISARLSDPWLPLLLAIGLVLVFELWRAHRTIRHMADRSVVDFVLLMWGAGLALAFVVEFLLISEISGTRTNTVFKTYYQIWVMWSVAGAGAAYYLLAGPARLSRLITRAVFAILLLVVAVLGVLYPLLAIPTRVTDIVVREPTLDVLSAAAKSPKQTDIAATYAAAQWLNQNVPGNPILLEAASDELWPDPARSRLSAWSGLPTLLGWFGLGHETQWRGGDSILQQRLPDIEAIYSSIDPNVAWPLLRQYNVAYVFVGPLERQQYPAAGLAKFDHMLSLVFQQDGVRIYRVP